MMRLVERLAAAAMVRPRSPTADLYLRNACADWIGPNRPIEQLAPGVFASTSTVLVIRHWAGLDRLPKRRRAIWLVDDDIDAAVADTSLPTGQRMKLKLFEQRHGAALLEAGAEVAVTSEALAERYGPIATTHLLRPHWSEPFADVPDQSRPGPLRIAYLGSAVHRGDLDFILPVLSKILRRLPNAEFHLASNHKLGPIARHPQLRLITETSWPAYRKTLRARGIHLALYPLMNTQTNRCRSVNKIIEHALAGAAGLYSDIWPESERIARRGAGVVLPNEPGAWAEAILHLSSAPAQRWALADRGRMLARDLNHPGLQRDFWRHAFALSLPCS